MKDTEFHNALEALGLSQTDAAKLLDVNPRTVRRWIGGEVVPGPVEQVIRAWLRLAEFGIAWRPDSEIIGAEDSPKIAQQLAAYRRHSMELDALIRKVAKRGGPAVPWKVDLKRRVAVLGPIKVDFWPLSNGGFSPKSYTRKDGDLDQERDGPILEDAFACIADAIRIAGKDWARD